MKIYKKAVTISAVFLFSISLHSSLSGKEEAADTPTKEEVFRKTRALQIPFIANEGQVDDEVRFYASTFGGTVFVTKGGEIVYSLPKYGEEERAAAEHDDKGCEALFTPAGNRDAGNESLFDFKTVPLDLSLTREARDGRRRNDTDSTESVTAGVALEEEFVGGRRDGMSGLGDTREQDTTGEISSSHKGSRIGGEERAVTEVSYFKGDDPSKWRSRIPTYDVVTLGEVYEGITVKLKAHGDNVEKLFFVTAGADPGAIEIRLSGASGLRINGDGELEAATGQGTVKFTKPAAYQVVEGKRVSVPVAYQLIDADERGNPPPAGAPAPSDREPQPAARSPQLTYRFRVDGYDRRRELVIDPLLASTFLGGKSSDSVRSLAVGPDGNIYAAGWTRSRDFPVTPGAYDTSHNGYYDVFITKLDGDLTTLLASTLLGGNRDDFTFSLALDAAGDIYAAGWTRSRDFPVTPGAYDTSRNGGEDVFIAKLDGDLTNLLTSTFLGGRSSDSANSLAVDPTGNIYVAGETWSSDFPVTPGAYDTSFNGYGDVFIAKLDGDLTTLLASTFLGGRSSDSANSLAVDPTGNIYVAGNTYSSDFPTTPGAYDTSYNDDWYGYYDVFITKLDGDLTSLPASTFLGGNGVDRAYSLAPDPAGAIYVAGGTLSSDFPATPGAYDTSRNSGWDAFLSKLDGDLTSLLASTFLGGKSTDIAHSLALNPDGAIYVTGETWSSDFPTTPGAYDTSHNGYYDTFLSKLDGDLTSLLASTLLGGNERDDVRSLAVGPDGDIYVAGDTYSRDFPTTPGAYDTSRNDINFRDVYISKLDGNLSGDVAAHYAFDKGTGTVARDSSGSGNHGRLRNGPLWTTGKRGGGVSFDGIDDFVRVPVMNSDEISIAAWFYKDTVDATYADALFGAWKWSSDIQQQEGFDLRFWKIDPGKIRFVVVTEDAAGNRTKRAVKEELGHLFGNWIHVVGTYSMRTGRQKLYINGQRVGGRSHPAGNRVVPLTSYPNMRIGHSRPDRAYFYGIIDEVYLYRKALSAEEVLELYNR